VDTLAVPFPLPIRAIWMKELEETAFLAFWVNLPPVVENSAGAELMATEPTVTFFRNSHLFCIFVQFVSDV
jgi:hypothetical protein